MSLELNTQATNYNYAHVFLAVRGFTLLFCRFIFSKLLSIQLFDWEILKIVCFTTKNISVSFKTVKWLMSTSAI